MHKTKKKLEELSAQNFYSCYQCGKCSGGCPSVKEMDMLPNEIMRLLQIGKVEEALNSKTIWICAACFTCTTRCPRGVELTKVMEALRQIHLRKNVDYMKIQGISAKEITKLPQIALVANFRKQTS